MMLVPGSNLLDVALSVIESQPVDYYRASAAPINAAGYAEPVFDGAVPVTWGSVQAVPRDKYDFLGLEQAKSYVIWYVPRRVLGIDRDSTGDRFAYAGSMYQITSTTEWHSQDGWTAAIAVRIGPDA